METAHKIMIHIITQNTWEKRLQQQIKMTLKNHHSHLKLKPSYIMIKDFKVMKIQITKCFMKMNQIINMKKAVSID